MHANEYNMLVCSITQKHVVSIDMVVEMLQFMYVDMHVGVLAYVALQDTHSFRETTPKKATLLHVFERYLLPKTS